MWCYNYYNTNYVKVVLPSKCLIALYVQHGYARKKGESYHEQDRDRHCEISSHYSEQDTI